MKFPLRAIGALVTTLCLLAPNARAGVDLMGTVTEVQIAQDGKLWFTINGSPGTTPPATYCRPGWAGLSMYVPSDNPQYAYYYATLMLSLSKSLRVYVANASVFDGTGPCDITKTGYGLMVLQ